MAMKMPKMPNRQEIKAFLKTDRAILMICIGIAFIFWLFTKLSYNYRSTLNFALEYQLPKDKVLSLPPADNIDIDVEASGWDLLGHWFSRGEFVLDLNIHDDNPQTLNAMNIKSRISRQLSDDIKILEIRPDFIQLQPESPADKEIPLVLDNQLELAPQHHFKSEIQLQPATVKIHGPASVVSEIKSWPTVPLIQQKVNSSVIQKVRLKPHPNSNVHFEPEEVKIIATVEPTTEKRLAVEIQKKGIPDSLLLVLLPKKVEISCIVGLSDYDRLSARDFEIIADFSKIDPTQNKSIRLQLKRKPKSVSYLQYQPKKVDYIIRSKTLMAQDSARSN
ncbi:hypothetical protein SapgrDRAFT_0111 [Saprospira grandis DSM 2844]|uniref:YbbR-like protein n=2 Tax=Saprospira TaxID=1007 RepID=J1HZQ5_9BACT|nr:hypothetical protein SapgrDRAFT_0111 [Saprospira grandis DSM 2844]